MKTTFKKSFNSTKQIATTILVATIISAFAGCDSPSESEKDNVEKPNVEQTIENMQSFIKENDTLIHIFSIPYAEVRKSALELMEENIDVDVTDFPYRYFDIDFDGVDEVLFEEYSAFSGRRGCFHYIYRKVGDSLVEDDDLPFCVLRDCDIIDIKNKTVSIYNYHGFDYIYVTFQKDPEKALDSMPNDLSDAIKKMPIMFEKQEKMKLVRIEDHRYFDTINPNRIYTADQNSTTFIFTDILTPFVWRDSIDDVFLWMDSDGSYFTFRVDKKTGKEYKYYSDDINRQGYNKEGRYYKWR